MFVMLHFAQVLCAPDLTHCLSLNVLQFGFPVMLNTNALEILGILTKLGYRDKRMHEAFDLVVSKQDEKGRWRLERSFNGRFQVNIEQEGKRALVGGLR